MKKFSGLYIILIFLLMTVPGTLLAEAATPYVVKVGEAAINVYGPAGLIQVDGLDPKVDELFKKMQPADMLILAVFAEPVAWKNFREAVNGAGEPSMLDYFASVASPRGTASLTITPEDFELFKDVLIQSFQNAVILGHTKEYLTYERHIAGGVKMVGSAVLLEGKIVLLNLYSSAQNPYQTEVTDTAIAWRNAYLRPAAAPAALSGTTEAQEQSPAAAQ